MSLACIWEHLTIKMYYERDQETPYCPTIVTSQCHNQLTKPNIRLFKYLIEVCNSLMLHMEAF